MDDYELLMIPGPTNLPEAVREALSRPQISHRVGRFKQLVAKVSEGLQALFMTEQPVLTLTSSSTGAMEAAIVNLLSPGEVVVCVDTGKFGDRLGKIAETYGAKVHRLKVVRGEGVSEAELGEACAILRPKAVLMVQNETSTGVCQNVAALAEIARSYGALSVVDAVSSLGGVPLRMDLWGLDAVIAGSQKTLMLPPGLGFVAFSARAWEAAAQATMPKFYFDLTKARTSLLRGGETPYTPNTSLFVALEVALDMIWEEGLEQRWERHRRLAAATRAGMAALKLSLFAGPNVLSDTITSVTCPVDSGELTRRVREEHKIIIGGGQDELKGRIFRIGHMGTCQLEQVLDTVSAIATVLNEMGYECDGPQAVKAAEEAY